MGIARGAVALLLEESRSRPFHGRIATLGRQTLYTTEKEVNQQFRKFGIAPQGPLDTLDDVALMRALGFSELRSLDYSDFEGATDVIDLNLLELPAHLARGFDVVLDSGTLEHVFHVPNA